MAVLVAYASKHGSTQGIAERIAEKLRQLGMQAEALPVEAIKDSRSYQAFVIGSATRPSYPSTQCGCSASAPSAQRFRIASSSPGRGDMREADMKCKVAAWLLPIHSRATVA
jgi:flavorubredoxin